MTNFPFLAGDWSRLTSHEDASVNHVFPVPDGGHLEARWVQRVPEYGIVYVSSHSGCAYACRFCHLTATGQTMMTPATADAYTDQLARGLSTYLDRRHGAWPRSNGCM